MACVASAPGQVCEARELVGAPFRAAARVKQVNVQAGQGANEAGADKERQASRTKSATLKELFRGITLELTRRRTTLGQRDRPSAVALNE